MMYSVDMQEKDPNLQGALRNLEHDAVLILQEFNKHYMNQPHVTKIDLDVDRILGNLKCGLPCCMFK